MQFSAIRFHQLPSSSARPRSRAKESITKPASLLTIAVAGGAVSLCAAGAGAAPIRLAQASWQAATSMPSKPYVIGPEDVLEIRLANHPQLNGTVTVRPDGKITFPRAGDVWASGRTTMALAAQLKTLLERTLNNVRVEVEVKTARARVARVMGAVRNPGTYDIKPSWRIVDLVAAGGGLSTKATRVSGRIVRGATIIPLDVPRAMAEPDSIANFPLLPNDLLVLDESSVPYQVTVSGKVTRPGAYELEDQLSLTKLLAKAGGVTEGAALKKAQILRGGVPIELDISESELQNPNSPAARFTLQVGDVLVVPENQARYGLLGQVARPAYYPLPENGENATLLKLLANAGGALPDADLHNATVTRTVDGKAQVATVDLSAMLEGQLPDNQTLLAGDVLFVPRKTAQVHVIGQVAKPGAYALDDRLTIPSLIAEAGNMVPGAALTKVYVLRDGARMPLNLSSVFLSGTPDPQTDNFRFQSGDVLVVPENQVRYAVMGQVARPGNYNYPDKPSDATVLKALAEAGGPLQGGGGGANLKQSSIVRTVNGQATAIPIDISALLQKGGVGNDTLLQPGDILYVPPKGAPKAALGGMLSFLGPLSLLLR